MLIWNTLTTFSDYLYFFINKYWPLTFYNSRELYKWISKHFLGVIEQTNLSLLIIFALFYNQFNNNYGGYPTKIEYYSDQLR